MFASRAPCRHVTSKQAARDVDHVPVLDIFWFGRLAADTRPKVNHFCTLFTVDYASQMNIARTSIVAHSARFHNRLVHSRRAIKRVNGRFIGKSGHCYRCQTALQCYQHFVVFKLPFVAADELILKIDSPFAGGRHFADQRETYLAVPPNFLRLIRDALVGMETLIVSPGASLTAVLGPGGFGRGGCEVWQPPHVSAAKTRKAKRQEDGLDARLR